MTAHLTRANALYRQFERDGRRLTPLRPLAAHGMITIQPRGRTGPSRESGRCASTRRDFTIGSLLAAGTLGLPIMVKAQQGKTVALLFDSLVSPFWVSGLEIMREKAKANGWEVLENISNFDDNKQFEQVKAMIGRKVDGILIIQTDSKAVIPAIRAANEAGIPMVHFNRPPAESDAYSVAIQADNRKIAAETVQFMVDEAKKAGKKRQAVIMIGDLGDVNAIQRRDGFFDVVDKNPDIVEVVARVSTEWNADKAFAGLTNALQANPDIDFLFTSSDFMLPQIQQVMETFDKWHKTRRGGPRHPRRLRRRRQRLPADRRRLHGCLRRAEPVPRGRHGLPGLPGHVGRQEAGEAAARPGLRHHPGATRTRPATRCGATSSGPRTAASRDRRAGRRRARLAHPLDGRLSMSTVGVTAAAPVPSAAERGSWLRRLLLSEYLVLLLTVALRPGDGAAGARDRWRADTWADILGAMMPLLIVAVGQAFVLIVAGIDLSATSNLAISSVLARRGDDARRRAAGGRRGLARDRRRRRHLRRRWAVRSGSLNGACVTRFNMPPFIVTLTTMMFFSGLAIWVTTLLTADGSSIGNLPRASPSWARAASAACRSRC